MIGVLYNQDILGYIIVGIPISALSSEWSSKLQSLLETHGPVPKLQPLGGPVKPSDNDPTNFGMINAPVSDIHCSYVV